MFASLRAEAIKLRRLRLGVIAVTVGALVSLLISMMIRATLVRLASEERVEVPWQNGLIGDAFVLIVLAFPAVVIIVTGLVFLVEHRNQTWKQLRTTPRSLVSIFAAKFVAVQLVIALNVAVTLAVSIAAWHLLPFEMRRMFAASDGEARMTLVRAAAALYVSLLPASVIQFVLSARFTNVLHAVGAGLALTFSCLLLFGPGTALWLPYAYPGAVVMSTFARQPGNGDTQSTDASYEAPPTSFASAAAAGKVIIVDEGHLNRHGLGTVEQPGTLRWIILPAESARIEVRGSYAAIDGERLAKANLLLVAGASANLDGRGAFAEEEIAAVVDFVRRGGSLLLLTDHEPFSSAAAKLAAAFSVQSTLRVVVDPAARAERFSGDGRAVFAARDGSLRPHAITSGVSRVVTYGGQAIRSPQRESIALLQFSRSARFADGGALPATESNAPFAQLIAFPFGRGRVVVSGETGVFTAQVKSDGSRIGVADRVADNERLAIQTLRWLLRLD